MPKITRIAYTPKLNAKKKVAAYCRVSSGKDAMLHSLSSQVSYYNDLIQKTPDWEFVGVYSDEAVTGTKDNRTNFSRMIEDCCNGKINILFTKSISRFARNTVTLLETVRLLKEHRVDVFFEEQNIHTMSSDGELMLTILASYAQEESLSVSENQKWRVKKNFEEGKPWSWRTRGYKLINGKFEIVKEDACIIQRIFDEYLKGFGCGSIAKRLTDDGVPTENGGVWRAQTIAGILRNYTYTGNLVLQKTYREDHITKRKLPNNGEYPKYIAEGTHEPIIPMETFEAVQAEIKRRAEKSPGQKPKVYPYTGIIVCAKCGKNFRRKITRGTAFWICSTYKTFGKEKCSSRQIPETAIDEIVAEITDSPKSIIKITADDDNKLTFHFKDGVIVTRTWKGRSRSEAWTEEMREKARQKALKGGRCNGTDNCNPCNKE